MRYPITLTALIALAAAPALAQESRTRTYDGPNATVSQTTIVDRDAGTLERDRTAMAKESGRSVSTSLDRQRTETGSTVLRSRIGPQGETRSFAGERLRAENGLTFTGTATARNGAQFGLEGSRLRDGAGNSQASQRLTGPDGRTLLSRERETNRTRTESGAIRTDRSVSRTRAPGLRPKRGRRSRN
jgi:hypothetical protein